MTVPFQPLHELNREAVAVLVRELGVARTLRFLGQYHTGQGDYTTDRHAFLEAHTVESLLVEARRLDASSSS